MWKGLNIASPRLANQNASAVSNYDITFKYMPGKQMYIADTLSSTHLNETETSSLETEDLDITVHELLLVLMTCYRF